MNSKVYELIKKQNGEHFARTIRNHCDAVFEIPNIIEMLKYAGRDSQPLLPYLMGLCQEQNKVIEAPKEVASPFALLHSAGYHAEYADTLAKQNAIKNISPPAKNFVHLRMIRGTKIIISSTR